MSLTPTVRALAPKTFAANDPVLGPPAERHCHAFPVRVWRDGEKNRKSPKIPAGADWHTYDAPPDAMRRARNIGVVIPAGVVALDLDVYKGVTREAVDKQLGCALEWDKALLQTTVSGGEHYIFSVPAGVVIKQGTNVAGIAGLDTRTTGKGWLCSGRGYTVRDGFGDALAAMQTATWPALPAPAIAKLAEPPAKPARDPSTASGDPFTGQQYDDLREALGFIDADARDTWLQVGMALHSTGAPEARELWDEWAAQSPKFETRAQEQAWRSFKPRADGVGVGTLFQLAKKAGWEGRPMFADGDDRPDLSHDSLALRLGTQGGWNDRARYVAKWGTWLFWDGARWVRDDKLRHMSECRDFLRDVANGIMEWAEARPKSARDAALKWAKAEAKNLRSAPFRNNIEATARSNAELVAGVDQFDANPDVVGTPGGTVDLRTGEVRPAMRADYITRLCAVTPERREPARWLRFLHEAMDGDGEMVAFLQRVAGYALTGHTREHKLPFLWGPGGNGKSVFANTLHDLFGDYAKRAPAETFLQSRNDRHPTDLAGLAGARLVIGSELPAGRAWNESVIKDLTGGDTITARFMRGDFFDYTPQFSLLMVGNHMPAVSSVDEAMRRRLLMIPFTCTVPPEKRDNALTGKLRDEWPGILQWAIDGAVAWYRDGLQVPGKVAGASGDYLDAEDVLGQFMDERLARVAGSKGERASVVYAEYAKWSEPRGGHAMTQRAFSQAMRERGIAIEKKETGRHFREWWLKEGAE